MIGGAAEAKEGSFMKFPFEFGEKPRENRIFGDGRKRFKLMGVEEEEEENWKGYRLNRMETVT